ncbi:hotdog fold thioesterase [Lentibacillus sp. L22]|uniref:hotdog fold thioesterase n=1 Tax=Lentibacillus TaxID=175304 RepID=UPI0022B191C3|nr:hotdog fold thioesterase [Lentibacillus daqui]
MDFSQTLIDTLGMKVITLEKNLVIMTMPVDYRTHQPAGFLHGGANVALAETAASAGAFLHVDGEQYNVFGIEINANHIRSKREGTVTAKAVPKHIGKTTMVWEINITDEDEKLICISRCTIGIVPKKKGDEHGKSYKSE